MPEAVLRIPIDDEAFKRYLQAFEKYQTQLRAQPDMWTDTNETILETVNAGGALVDTINRQVDAAQRLGNIESRNAQRKRKEMQDEDSEQKRQQSWRRQALDHVQELSRASGSIVRSFGNFASGSGTGGLFGGVASIGNDLGGTLGGIVKLAGHVLNAGYEINKAVSDKGQQAIGIGTGVGRMEGAQNYLGAFTDPVAGIDAVTNARGSPGQWASFARMGIKPRKGEDNADLWGRIIRRAADIGEQATGPDGQVRQDMAGAKGAYDFMSPEDLRRIIARDKAGMLNSDIANARNSQAGNPLTDKAVQSATSLVQAQDNLVTTVRDSAQALGVKFDPALMAATKGLQDLANVAEKIVGLFPSNWSLDGAMPTLRHLTPAQQAAQDKAAAADPSNPQGKGLWGGLKAMWNSPWFSVHHEGQRDGANSGLGSWLGGGGGAISKAGAGAKIGLMSLDSELEKRGIGHTAALGSAAGIIGEGGGLGMADNGAFGIGQWRGGRQQALFKKYGKNASLSQQLDFLASELKGGDAHGKDVLTAKSIAEALWAYADKFMRPDRPGMGHDNAKGDFRRGSQQLVKVGITYKDQTGVSPSVTANSAARSQ